MATTNHQDELPTLYGLPKDIVYCRKCVMSNQRPSSMPEFTHIRARRGARYLNIDEERVCDACRYAERKASIDWESRELALLKLLDQHRSEKEQYDCIVPGSGGKDSGLAAHVLKYKYGMHPLTVTWPPTLPTDYGQKNFRSWLTEGGFDNIQFSPNGRVHKLLTKLAVENLLHPFQTFILGQKNLAVKLALKMGIPLVFYGESEGEYGNPIAETLSSLRDNSFHTFSRLSDVHLAGLSVAELAEKHGLTTNDLLTYLPVLQEHFSGTQIEVHYLGYYLRWTPQEAYYYAVEHTGFEARPFRTQGTYSKYNSIDDKIDDLHYYSTWIKFGLGRATYDASQEIRNRHLNREEGIQLVRKFDGEFPDRYFNEVMDYLGIDGDHFGQLCDQFRSPHLWKKNADGWELRHPVWNAD